MEGEKGMRKSWVRYSPLNIPTLNNEQHESCDTCDALHGTNTFPAYHLTEVMSALPGPSSPACNPAFMYYLFPSFSYFLNFLSFYPQVLCVLSLLTVLARFIPCLGLLWGIPSRPIHLGLPTNSSASLESDRIIREFTVS